MLDRYTITSEEDLAQATNLLEKYHQSRSAESSQFRRNGKGPLQFPLQSAFGNKKGLPEKIRKPF